MDEYTSIYTGYFRKLIVTHASPYLGKCLSTVETLGRDRDCLDTPVPPSLVRVYDVEREFIAGNTLLGLKIKQMLLPNASELSGRP